MPIIDLRERFPEYRVEPDPATLGPHEQADPMLCRLPCRYGTIYPYADDLLAVGVHRHPIQAGRLVAFGFRLHRSQAGVQTFLFPVERFAEVALVMEPRRKKRLLSPAALEKLRANAAKAREAKQRKRAARTPVERSQ